MAAKIIKSGKLRWLQLDCPDIERFFLRRLFRKFGVVYVPWTLIFYDQVYLREDKSKYNRSVVNFCKKHSIQTYVVQEGDFIYTKNHTGHLPLHADYFICTHDTKELWIEAGMPKDRIRVYYPDKPKKFYSGIVFLSPIYLAKDFLHPWRWNGRNASVMEVICDYMTEDVLFKLHNKNYGFVKQLIPPHRIIEGNAEDLIMRYDKIYCFPTSSIRGDCDMLGREYTVVGDEDRGCGTHKETVRR